MYRNEIVGLSQTFFYDCISTFLSWGDIKKDNLRATRSIFLCNAQLLDVSGHPAVPRLWWLSATVKGEFLLSHVYKMTLITIPRPHRLGWFEITSHPAEASKFVNPRYFKSGGGESVASVRFCGELGIQHFDIYCESQMSTFSFWSLINPNRYCSLPSFYLIAWVRFFFFFHIWKLLASNQASWAIVPWSQILGLAWVSHLAGKTQSGFNSF